MPPTASTISTLATASNRPCDVAIVGEPDLAVGQAGAGQPRLGERLLLGRQGQAGDVDAIVARRDLGEPAPAAAYLEQALAGLQVEPVEQSRFLRACACSSGSSADRLGEPPQE